MKTNFKVLAAAVALMAVAYDALYVHRFRMGYRRFESGKVRRLV